MITPEFTHDRPGTDSALWAAHPARLSLPELTLTDADGTAIDRLVVLAAHPDDETLGAAGLMATAAAAGIEVELVLLTDGEGSHPRSPTLTPAQLGARRRQECRRALDRVAPDAAITHLGLPDGGLAAHEDAVVHLVTTLVGDGRGALLVAPWRHDGHPDHEAAGRVAGAVARRTSARSVAYPVWFWHWGRPEDAPWDHARRLALDPVRIAAKAAAVAEHVSQVAPLSDLAGDETLLSVELLSHFAQGDEVFFEEEPADDALDRLHTDSPDPWGVDRRWYEARKRDLVAAMLPGRRYDQALELGCSTGALALDLSARCDRLVAVDAGAEAVWRATTRLLGRPGVRVEQHRVPDTWPAGNFDLVVLSEVGYFLSPRDLDGVIERIEETTTTDAVVVLCHWRHPVAGYVLDGADVHAAFRRRPGAEVLASYVDRDVEILVLGPATQLPDPHA